MTWASSNTGVSTINSSGLAAAVSPGGATISAALNGVTGGTGLTVQSVPLSITTQSLANGALNMSYSSTLAAQGGTVPYTWSVASGSLPAGLSLNAYTGTISGTPTSAGTVNIIAQVVDSGTPAQTTSKSFSVFIEQNGPILIITSPSNPFSGYYAESCVQRA